jgi:hypothetical protein
MLAHVSFSDEPRAVSVVDIIELGMKLYNTTVQLQIRSQLDPAIEIRLLDKPHIHCFPFPARLFEFKVKVSN